MKELSGQASVVVGADEDAARTLVRDVEHYSQWHGETVREVQVLSRDAQGRAERVHARLRASFGPLDRDFEIMLTIRDEGPADVVLDRLPHEPRDGEALSMRWTLSPAPGSGRGTLLRLALSAKLDVPRMLPLPRGVANDLARRFVEAAAATLGGAAG